MNKTLFFDFWFRPPNAQNLLPKICTKSPISRLVWQIDRRCLGLPWCFWVGWTIQWNHETCGADLCSHGNEIWARRGDPVAYQLVCTLYQVVCVLSLVVGGTAPTDTYEVALLNGCDLQDASQFIPASQQQQQQQLAVLYNNNILPISEYIRQSALAHSWTVQMLSWWSSKICPPPIFEALKILDLMALESPSVFIMRDSIYATARIYHANSVCLSHVCIVSKRLNISSKFFHYLLGPSF